MPEGDTLFRSAERLSRALSGRVITQFETVFAELAAFHHASPVVGRTVESVTAQGKHLLMTLSGPAVLRTHMRMNGAWHLYRPGERWFRARARMRILLGTDAFVAVAFDVPVAELRASDPRVVQPALARLGPDYLAPGFDPAQVVARMRPHADVELGVALLDQSIAAGVGNVYKSEVLFACGVDPFARVGAVSDEVLGALATEAQRQLRRNVRPTSGDGPQFYDGARYTTPDSRHPHAVYGRGGEPCLRCGTQIRVEKQGIDARLTFYCASCQRVGRPAPGTPQSLPRIRLGGLARRR